MNAGYQRRVHGKPSGDDVITFNVSAAASGGAVAVSSLAAACARRPEKPLSMRPRRGIAADGCCGRTAEPNPTNTQNREAFSHADCLPTSSRFWKSIRLNSCMLIANNAGSGRSRSRGRRPRSTGAGADVMKRIEADGGIWAWCAELFASRRRVTLLHRSAWIGLLGGGAATLLTAGIFGEIPLGAANAVVSDLGRARARARLWRALALAVRAAPLAALALTLLAPARAHDAQ